MGNSCVGPNGAGRSGFLASVAIWRAKPAEPAPAPDALQASTSEKKAPEPVTIPAGEHSSSHGARSADPPPPKPAEPSRQQSMAPVAKKPVPKVKRVQSAGLLADSVLKRDVNTARLKDLYTIGKKLGQGQFGTTYVCVEKATGKEYACKSIAKRKLLTDEDVEDVRREIQIMHHLAGHSSVVSIVGAYEDAVAVQLVMELCAGGELFDRIIQRGTTPRRPRRSSPGPYYVAPEVLLKNYGREVDVWSAGVIIYILLSGVPPFWDESEQGIFEQVLKGELDFTTEPWPSISDSAKDLVRKMLIRDPKKRLTAHEALCHPWVCVDGVAPDKPLDSAVLSRLKQFSAMNKLKKMALRVIAESLSEEEIAGLKEMFKMLDTDNSGHITLEELKSGLRRVGATLMDSEIDALMEAADIDNSGTIDYGEFIAATMHMNKVDKEDKLFAAFQYFDKDGSGYITQDELQKACEEFGIGDTRIEDIIGDVDKDNDGKIDYNEFVEMMQKGNNPLGRKGQQSNVNFGLGDALKLR
ncbi:hypothetical protein ZWY2020_017991 [Hordeum vulgare]|nr:hypothetical protein ZWY2020_017991 [Hordeum vulgare]